MKIIDNKKDFYDFYQGIYRDDSLVFDRRNSFIFKKEDFAHSFSKYSYNPNHPTRIRNDINNKYYISLQICNSFWIFEIEALSYRKRLLYSNDCEDGVIEDYKIKEVDYWKNYNVERKLIELRIQRINNFWYNFYKGSKQISSEEYSKEVIKSIRHSIEHNDYNKKNYYEDITRGGLYSGKNENKIPILQEIGIGCVNNSLDVYLAFEEYFSKEKTKDERSESIGLTDKEKIENHGFDTTTSFRGK